VFRPQLGLQARILSEVVSQERAALRDGTARSPDRITATEASKQKNQRNFITASIRREISYALLARASQ
jgi:hypothetical protein